MASTEPIIGLFMALQLNQPGFEVRSTLHQASLIGKASNMKIFMQDIPSVCLAGEITV